MSFNFMATVTICSDLGATPAPPPKKINQSLTVSIVSPSICHEMMGPDAHDLSFLNVEL